MLLKIILNCQKYDDYKVCNINDKLDKSLNERSKALMLRITENEVNALTGKHTNNMNGMYFKVQLPSLSSNTDFKKEIDENTGILHINTIKIITQDIPAKCSDS